MDNPCLNFELDDLGHACVNCRRSRKEHVFLAVQDEIIEKQKNAIMQDYIEENN